MKQDVKLQAPGAFYQTAGTSGGMRAEGEERGGDEPARHHGGWWEDWIQYTCGQVLVNL